MTDEQLAVLSECRDDLGYLVMRVLRIVLAAVFLAASLVLLLVSMGYFLHFGFDWELNLGYGHWYIPEMTLLKAWSISGAYTAGVLTCFMLSIAVGTPYRYAARKPGLGVRTCGKCGVSIKNTPVCGNCGSARPAWAFSMATGVLSWVLAILIGVFDFICVILGRIL